jgi:hypothetical protein
MKGSMSIRRGLTGSEAFSNSCPELSPQSFLDTANAATAKLAVCLDMGLRRGVWNEREVEDSKQLLVRVGQMTAKKGYAD